MRRNQTWEKKENGKMELVEDVEVPDRPHREKNEEKIDELRKDFDKLRKDFDNLIFLLKSKGDIT